MSSAVIIHLQGSMSARVARCRSSVFEEATAGVLDGSSVLPTPEERERGVVGCLRIHNGLLRNNNAQCLVFAYK